MVRVSRGQAGGEGEVKARGLACTAPPSPIGIAELVRPRHDSGPSQGQDGWPQPVQLHPCSVNFPVTSFPGRWMVYCDKVQTSAVFLR